MKSKELIVPLSTSSGEEEKCRGAVDLRRREDEREVKARRSDGLDACLVRLRMSWDDMMWLCGGFGLWSSGLLMILRPAWREKESSRSFRTLESVATTQGLDRVKIIV